MSMLIMTLLTMILTVAYIDLKQVHATELYEFWIAHLGLYRCFEVRLKIPRKKSRWVPRQGHLVAQLLKGTFAEVLARRPCSYATFCVSCWDTFQHPPLPLKIPQMPSDGKHTALGKGTLVDGLLRSRDRFAKSVIGASGASMAARTHLHCGNFEKLGRVLRVSS